MRYILVVINLLLVYHPLIAQKRNNFTKLFQASIAPGVSTNGLHAGGYSNYFSLNLSSGYSAANYLLELGVISNLNENETRGLQIAGLFNVTGGNAFAGMQAKEIDKTKREGFEANLSGAQFSGLGNIVLNNVFGWQTSGGVNVAKGALQGLQIAGVSNTVKKYSFGVQLAGLYNVSAESMDGVQVSSLFNITQGGLFGLQIAAFNGAGFIEGKNSYDNNDPTGFQIGLFNTAKRMNGFQIGLVNKSKRMQGTQIGLVNLYRGGSTPQTRDGTSIGLLNIGSSGYAALYANEIFFINVEIATGTIKNRRMTEDAREKQVQNSLLYSNDPSPIQQSARWAFGYGLKKFFFNRSATPGMSKFRYLAYGIDFMHINNHHKKLTKNVSLLTRPNISVGSRMHPKLKSIYLFASVTYNAYFTDANNSIAPSFLEAQKANSSLQLWPGMAGGVLIQ